jgi:dihydrofolate synthase/folylpolyglutamate synthase
MKTYDEVIDFLFQQFPSYQQKGGSAYKIGLDNIQAICNIIGNPENKIKTIHIAGTNGKGTVSNYLTNIYQQNGYKVGTFTSPHLIDFRERITINGKWIPKKDVVNFYDTFKNAFSQLAPSFFEWSTALALHYFHKENTDVNIIETGLGGRLDSTNVIQPLLSIITTIGLDHKELLGDNKIAIAKEKAGIIKERTSVLLGPDIKETLPVFKKICQEKNAPFYQTKALSIQQPILPAYLIHNWEIALEASSILSKEFPVSTEDNPKKYLTIKGRWHVVQDKPKMVLDVGHNEEGINAIVNQLDKESYDQLHIMLGFSSEKEIDKILPLFPKEATYYITKSSNERSANPILIQSHIRTKNANCYLDFKEAFHSINKAVKKDDFVLICGSVFLVGDILQEFF